MSCLQAATYRPSVGLVVKGPNKGLGQICASMSLSSPRSSSSLLALPPQKLHQHKVYTRLVSSAPSTRCAPLHAFSGDENPRSKNEPFSMESLKKAIGGLRREKTIQEMLRERLREQDYGNGGRGDKNSPGGGGGDGSGGSEDDGLAGILDELLQVVLATIGFIFVYIYIIRGEELTRLARDYIKYLFGAQSSMRLKKAMYKWRKFYESIARKEMARADWLEREIVATPTWWHNPRRLARLADDIIEDYKHQQQAQES